jgi:hypothetical protein
VRIPAASTHARVVYVSRRSDDPHVLVAPNDGDLPCPFFEDADQCCLQRLSASVHLPVAVAALASCPAAALPADILGGPIESAANRSSLLSSTLSADGTALDVSLFLSYEAVKTEFATEHVQQGGSNLAWFIGVARVRTNGNLTAIQGAHRYFNAFVGSTYTLTTAAGVARVAAPLLDIEIIRVQDAEGARFFDFARVRVTLVEVGVQFAAVDAIPASSAMFKIQYGVSDGAGHYMCQGYDPQIFAAFQAAHPCALQAPPCVPQLSSSGQSLTHVFPLGVDALAATLAAYDTQTLGLTQNLYLDFFLRLESGGTAVLERIQTSSEILRQVLRVQCATVRSDVSLGSMLSLDMIGGLLQNASDLNRTVSYFRDVSRPVSNEVCDQDNPRSICMETPKLGMGSMTYVLLGSDDVFASPASAEYHIRVSSMFSVYFMSELKKIAVRNLLRAGRAFVLPAGQSLERATQLVPSEELLTLCPMAVTRGNYGCISRFEVEDSILDFETASIAAVSMPYDNTTSGNATSPALRSWVTAGAFGGSDYMRDVVAEHADLVVSMFGVNNRFRTAFLQSPTLPWTPAALAAINVSTRIDAVQDTFSFILVTMDSSRHEFREDVYAHLRIPVLAPVTCAVFGAHPYLEKAVVNVLVAVIGGSHRLFSLDPALVDEGPRCALRLRFDLPYQVQARSLAQGEKLARVLRDPHSALARTLAAALLAEFADLQARTGLAMAALNDTDFRGTGEAELVPYATAAQPSVRRRRGARVLASVNDEPVHLANLTRNESVFASEVSTRRYKDVNSADKMAELVEEDLVKGGGGGQEIANGTSRLALLELLVPASIACMANESLAMAKMQEFLREALQKSSATAIAAITPTSFVTLDSLECQEEATPGRRLLQSRFFRSRTEIVFSPAKTEDTKVKPIIVQPTTILRNLPGDLQLVKINAVPSNNENAVEVAAAWGDGELPAIILVDPVNTIMISLPEEPTGLIRVLHISIIVSLVLAALNLGLVAYNLSTAEAVYAPLKFAAEAPRDFPPVPLVAYHESMPGFRQLYPPYVPGVGMP